MTESGHLLIQDLYGLSQRFLDIHHQPYQRQILNDFMKSRFGLLIGPRGVGKTTFLIQQLLQAADNNPLSPAVLYIPTDHFLIGQSSLYDIAESFYQMGGKVIAFDEIHQSPTWSSALKSIFDTFPQMVIMASGSSALKTRQGTHDLSRRAVVRTMPGYSFREYLELEHQLSLPCFSLLELLDQSVEIIHEILKKIEGNSLKILPLFKEYLRVGYYPYYRQFNDANLYYITLEQNMLYTLDTDLPMIYPSLTGYSIRKMKQLMSYIAGSVPFTANISQLKQMMDIGDERTLKMYLYYLHDCSLIRLCMKSSSQFKKLESPEKIYLDNPNQMHALAPMNPNIGTMRELFFLSMLSYQHEVTIPLKGDFMVDQQYIFEIGGRNKDPAQIKGLENAFLASDDIEHGHAKKIPLWLLGFLY